MDRYFVDERSGIVAVRDRVFTDPDYNGLHPDTSGVVKSCFGHRVDNHWELNQEDIDEMNDYCDKLNSGEVKLSSLNVNEGRLFLCQCGGKFDWNYGRNLFDYKGCCDSCGRIVDEYEMAY